TVSEVDALTRKLEAAVYGQTGIILTGVSVYAYNTGDNEAARIRDDVREKVLAHEWALEMHGFYVDLERRSMRFDVVMSFDIDPREGLQTVYDEIRRAYPDYALQIIPDVDVSVSG
ncbi:MAG: cation transporter, partial [Clostridia bacterium]|nr:cation transporter [Clostridia bacterium]